MSKLIERLQSASMKNQSVPSVAGEEPMTFSQLWSRTDAFAGGLRNRDITAGDTVGIRVSNPQAFLIAFYGTLRNGSVPVTMPVEYGARDISTALNETNSMALVTDQRRFTSVLTRADSLRVRITVDCDSGLGVDFATFVENSGINSSGTRSGIDIVRRADEDRGLIAYVGYHDRKPLAVTYSRSTLAAAARAGAGIGTRGDYVDTENGGDDRTDSDAVGDHLGAVPLSSPLALLYGATGTILAGNRYRPLETWDPETVRSIRYTTDLDRVFVTPQQHADLRQLGTDDDRVTVLESTSDNSTTDVEYTASAIHLYGTPETGLTHRRSPADVREDRIGTPLPGIETKVYEGADVDELVIDGPATMDGYFDRPELTADAVASIDGTRWIRTGTPVRTENGTIYLDGPRAVPSTEY